MLQIQNVCKKFTTGDSVQTALDNVSLNFRDSEFVAILGPSGSGKTTMLNILGGLDRYDSGDLIINGISTKQYKDSDWDSYRNHTIGFVFQSYNLIPHQSVLSNVELALTLSGISKAERIERAKKALSEVGLSDHIYKKPNQLSGGQMQRVAIARALINNPDIVLADEPTGALDSETSVQIMELLKEVATKRLVVMVTHNPELASEYATRIVKLRDGHIKDDTNPYDVDSQSLKEPEHKNMGKSSMSFLTSLSLSFNNLRTKKARTLLTAFAGSIGIIGISLILALSTGVDDYITNIQKETMTSYPISIESQSMDLSSLISDHADNGKLREVDHELDAVYSNFTEMEMASSMTTSISKNNLTNFKKYLDDSSSDIHNYIGEHGIVYSYNPKFKVFTYDPEDKLVNTDGSTLDNKSSDFATVASMGTQMMSMATGSTDNGLEEIMPGTNDSLISQSILDSYDVVHGAWPQKFNEVVLVLDRNNEVSATYLYNLGILPSSEYKDVMATINDGEKLEMEDKSWSYKDLCNKDFYLMPTCDAYVKNDNGNFTYIGEDTKEIEDYLEDAVKIKISGIIKPKEDAPNANITKPLGYTRALTDYLIDHTNKSEVVTAQQKSKDINVVSGLKFSPDSDKEKISDTKKYVKNMGITEKANLAKSLMKSMTAQNPQMAMQLANATESQLAQSMDQYIPNAKDDVLLSIYDNYISTGTYDENLENFGVISLDAPSSIDIYVDTFEDKEAISDCIEKYNETAKEEDKITYTDYIALLLSSVTTIIDVISYVLIAFVSVSLIVSSIMIGIITYISVLERTKEIGILRAIGASKNNISQVFNAETFIIGFISGIMGVGISYLITLPANAIIHKVTGITTINARIPLVAGVILVVLSMVLTLIGGIIPAKKAAKKDPVTALRTE